MEDYAIAVLLGELTLALLVWIWLLVRAFNQHVAWGFASLVLPPLALFSRGAMLKGRSGHLSCSRWEQLP